MREQHRMSDTRLYSIWKNMKQRCNNYKNDNYIRYGAKGVRVCEEWSASFTIFYNWAIANGYSDDLTIDRKDSSKGYEPSNCRWITHEENASRANIGRKGNNGGGHFTPVTYKGKTQPLKAWAQELDISYNTLHKRVHTDGWTIERAFTTPVRRIKVK